MSRNKWVLVGWDNGISAYQNVETGEIDTVDMQGDDDNS